MQLPVSAQGSSSSLADSESFDRAGGKRHRTRFTPNQLSTMEAAFSAEKYPDMKARQELSEKLGLSEIQVQVSIMNGSYSCSTDDEGVRANHKVNSLKNQSDGDG